VRRAIGRAGLDTARVGADEIAVPRSTEPPPSAPPSSDRPVIELPELEPLPDPTWSTWAVVEPLEPTDGARPVAEAIVPPSAQEDFPPDADGSIEDPAETFGWPAPPGPDGDPAARRARSGNVRFVRPDDERTPHP